MKKFAYLKWAKNWEEIFNQMPWLKIFPSFLRENVIIHFCPLKLKERWIMDLPGFEVILPFTAEQVNKKAVQVIQDYINKVIERLKTEGVKIICPPKGHSHEIDFSILEAKGQYVISLLIFEAIKKLSEKLEKPLKYIEITIIDGQNLRTDLVLNILYPELNYLSILTDKTESFREKAVDIYEDVGLNLQIISYNKKTVLENSDIIIDCRDVYHSSFYYCKKNAIYIYIGGYKEMVRDILLKRKDLKIIDNVSLVLKNESYCADFCEMLWYLSKTWFKNILSGNYDLALLQKVIKEIRKEGWVIGEFYQYGRILDINQFNHIDKFF
ncbi:MAG TPA: hypothetical protein PLC16_02830 [Defluviitaleaceae bacterium]|nr:hypothetical protein [Defluviitaleaceae bacterium]HPT75657.1 hypothetical protein [Defluviitaleaceae bacterium]